ncbi:UNKNOWN [Stylonychia lemnae]|uniref:Uncharacterized protein n=1 Tax=Stylonychia lemnae TaxID=5949 RepID=A0A078A8F4_STYLE|nr:UNKNOWN [Stylonychia lemnae]|eukprot:CDW77061.1 UNKNOWN [Stylonychia lemnae]
MNKYLSITGAVLVGSMVGTSDANTLQQNIQELALDRTNLIYLQALQRFNAQERSKIYGSGPKVERGFSLHNIGHATGIAGDLVGIGANIYGAVHQPHVERGISLHNLNHATGIASDLVGIGANIYGAVHNVQAMADDEEDDEIEVQRYLGGPQVEQYFEGPVYVRPSRYQTVVYPYDD